MAETRKSLDDLELELYKPFRNPTETPFSELSPLPAGTVSHAEPLYRLSLDGEWALAEGGYTDVRTDLSVAWQDAIPAQVPNSIHTSLFEAGLIDDPLFGINDKRARENSYKIWWYKKTFHADENLKNPTLCFEGVCYRAMFWLNGEYLGFHSGMFGGPFFSLAGKLKEENTLIVKIENAPSNPYPYSEYADYDDGWWKGVVINCVYGWHYACIPSRGIWRSVSIASTPATTVEKPFFYATDHEKGLVDLILFTDGAPATGKIGISISPKNFEGPSVDFETDFVKEAAGEKLLHYRMAVPEPRLWWPNGMGDQNLYQATVTFAPDGDIPSFFRTGFGIRTVKMAPLPGGPYEDKLNFTYVINGKPMFIKGTNWCTMDALLRFPKERYQRALSLLKQQHVQLLRAWGGGMPESDVFYDLCDELGLMVRQEWPTCWDSDRQQPADELRETVKLNLIRIRNHPSLVTLAGGNESKHAESYSMTEIARASYEHDGSRKFHKTSPYGGAIHSYITYWDRHDIDATLNLEAPFIGEFGMASAPNHESVRRYLPDDEKDLWPPRPHGSFYHHMPKFNESHNPDIMYIGRLIHEFSRAETMEEWIWASQMAQATVIRHLLEKIRSRWPESVGICYYKSTDVYPACSWATVDYYGAPKQVPYYIIGDSYAPVGAALIFSSIDVKKPYAAPVYFFDDNQKTVGKTVTVTVTAFDSDLSPVKRERYDATGRTGFSSRLGEFVIGGTLLSSSPIFITAEVKVDDENVFRTFWWLNFRERSGCMRDLNRTVLSCTAGQGKVTVTNTGTLPAVGVSIECPEKDLTFETEDSMLFLVPGETVTLTVNETAGLRVKAWNADEVNL